MPGHSRERKELTREARYLKKTALMYSLAGLVSLLMLIALLFYIFANYRDYITYSNFKYLMRDFTVTANDSESSFKTIEYDSQTDMDFSVFKDGFAVAGKEKFVMYDPSGLLICEDTLGYQNPVFTSSDKYLLAYDLTGKSYCIYNSLTRVLSRNTELKIIDAEMSDSGAFILTTRSNETKYVVELYNEALNKTMSVYKDNYIIDTAITSDGKRFAVVSAIPTDTNFMCEICIYEKGADETINTLNYGGVMPLRIEATENGYVVICDTMLYFLSQDGDVINSVSFSGMTLDYGDISSSLVAITGSTNALSTQNRLLVYTLEGNLVYAASISERVRGVTAPEHYDPESENNVVAYLRTTTTACRVHSDGSIDYANEMYTDIPEGNDIICMRANGNGVILCTDTKAYSIFDTEQ